MLLSNPELVAWLLLRMDNIRNQSMTLALSGEPLTMPDALELATLKGRHAELVEVLATVQQLDGRS